MGALQPQPAVSGVVLDAATGLPVRGAVVTGVGGSVAHSDASGRFPAIRPRTSPAGDVLLLSVTAAGYAPSSPGIPLRGANTSSSLVLTVQLTLAESHVVPSSGLTLSLPNAVGATAVVTVPAGLPNGTVLTLARFYPCLVPLPFALP